MAGCEEDRLGGLRDPRSSGTAGSSRPRASTKALGGMLPGVCVGAITTSSDEESLLWTDSSGDGVVMAGAPT